MASRRVLVVGSPGALYRELLAYGDIVHHAPMNRRLWTALASNAWDACIFEADAFFAEDYELVRHARETQPNLALLVSCADEREGLEKALESGVDDWVAPRSATRAAPQVVAQAVALRRARVRGRAAPHPCHVLVMDWDQLEAPAVCATLEQHGFCVARAADARTALQKLRTEPVHVFIAPPAVGPDDSAIVKAAMRFDPRLRIVVASDVVDLERTARAMGHGAHDYLLRPVGTEQALGAVSGAWAAHANTSAAGEVRAQLIELLLIEPHELQAHLVEEMLAQEGRFATMTVRDLGQARRAQRERSFDAIIYHPDSRRSEALRFLHELRCVDHQPAVILLARRPDARLHEQALRIGAQDIISLDRLGREALGARVRNAVARNQYRLAHERFVRDLQTREASQQEVVRRSVDGMLIVDGRGCIVFANPAAERMFSHSAGPLLGKRFPYPLSSDGPREVQIRNGEMPCVADVTEVAIDWNGSAAHLVSLRDVTERRQAQELRDRLAHTERLAAIGQLAAGVTHEINNPAAYVVANLTTMLDLVGDLEREAFLQGAAEAKLRELGEMIRENLDGMSRIRSITSDLRTFARIGSNEVTLVNLNDCVISACKLAMNEIRHRAHLVQSLVDLPRIPGSHGKLAQVVTNLLVNAAQAIPEGNVGAHRISVRTGASDDEVWLQVEDTGRGISPQVQAKIFDPFFTTKGRAQGTGLGLALCADIVGQHQGTISAVSSAEGGTCFTVRLPRDTQLELSTIPPPSPSRVVPRPRSTRQLRLLLIDDEPLVLRSLRRMLGEHQVDTAQSGSEALARLKHERNYDLIFCDLMMPEMDGTILYAEIERRMPELLDRIIFCSGGAFTTRTKQFVEQSTLPFLEKPMTRESFERVVTERFGQRHLKVVGDA